MRVVCLLLPPGSPLKEIAECCYRWTPQIAIREDEAVFLEVSQCKNLYKEENFLLKLQILLRRFDVKGRVAVSHDPALSLALARFPFFASKPYELPLEALYDVASPFKKDPELKKQAGVLVGVLKKLGLGTLDDFRKLPARSLSSRFQFFGVELHRRLNTASHSSWPVFVPIEKIIENANLHDHENCQSIEPLLFVLKNLLGRAMARLAGRGERLARFQLDFELEKYSTVPNPKRSWTFQLPLPQGSAAGLLPLIQEKLQGDLTRQPLASPVAAIKFQVLETAPGQYAQRNFFSKKEEEQEVWNSLMARLCQKLGKAHVFVASPVESYKPEGAWTRRWDGADAESLEHLEGIELPLSERPLRLLKNPQVLSKIHNSLRTVDYGFAKEWEIQDWEGPERLQGEWWGSDFQRDYFRVGAKNGEQLWVFRVPDTDKLYLHGFFD